MLTDEAPRLSIGPDHDRHGESLARDYWKEWLDGDCPTMYAYYE